MKLSLKFQDQPPKTQSDEEIEPEILDHRPVRSFLLSPHEPPSGPDEEIEPEILDPKMENLESIFWFPYLCVLSWYIQKQRTTHHAMVNLQPQQEKGKEKIVAEQVIFVIWLLLYLCVPTLFLQLRSNHKATKFKPNYHCNEWDSKPNWNWFGFNLGSNWVLPFCLIC